MILPEEAPSFIEALKEIRDEVDPKHFSKFRGKVLPIIEGIHQKAGRNPKKNKFSLHCWNDLKAKYPALEAIWENSSGDNTRGPFISANDVVVTISSFPEHEEQEEQEEVSIQFEESFDKQAKEMSYVKKEEGYSEVSTLASERTSLRKNDTLMMPEDQYLDISSNGINEE